MVVAFHFHFGRIDPPDSPLHIHFGPLHEADVAGSACGQDHELDGASDHRSGRRERQRAHEIERLGKMNGTHVLRLLPLPRQRPSDDLEIDAILTDVLAHRPIDDGPHPLKDAARRLLMGQPDRRQHLHHVRARERGDRLVPDQREGVVFQCRQPLIAMLAVAPALQLIPVNGPRCLGETGPGHRNGLALRHRVDAVPKQQARLQRLVARVSQRHRPLWPQRQVAALPFPAIAQLPIAAALRIHV